MKKGTFISFIALLIFTLDAFGQSGLKFSDLVWDFGSINEEEGIQSHRFEFLNEGEYPEVLVEVTSTCGCTKPKFSRKPILPGEKSAIEVQFQPAGQRGAIDRVLTVFGDRREIVARLHVKGYVEPRVRSVEERFPIEVGEGLRLTNNFLSFGNLKHGEFRPIELKMVNTSQRDHHIRIEACESSGLLFVEHPEVIRAGEEAVWVVRYALAADSRRYGTLRDTYYIEVDGKRQRTRFGAQATAIDNPTQQLLEAPPAGRLVNHTIRLGDLHEGEAADGLFTIRNEGKSPLIIRAVELPEGVSFASLRPGDRIPQGEERQFELRFESNGSEYGIRVERLQIVTNDPQHPLLQLRIVANIIE